MGVGGGFGRPNSIRRRRVHAASVTVRAKIRDVFGNEDSGFDHFLHFQDGKHALESVTVNDSHKKPRYDAVNDVKTSIYREDPATVPTLPRKDGSTILDFQVAKEEDENGTGNSTLCSDYSLPAKRGVVHRKKHGDISSANAFTTVSTNKQRDGDDDLQAYGCPNIRDFEDFDSMFRTPGSTFVQGNTATEEISWFSSTSHCLHGFEDTLQSVVLASNSESSAFNNISSSHGLCINILPAINTETSFGNRCSPLPMYPDTEWKGKSACVDAGIVEKGLALEHIGYGNEYRDPNMINMNIKEPYTTTGKKINSTLGSTVESSFCGCELIQNVQIPELHSSVLSAYQSHSLQPILKNNLLSESYASNCLHPYNIQAQPSNILKLENLGPTLNSVVIHSSSLLDYVSPNTQSSLPGFFPMPSMPIEKNNKIHARQKSAAAFLMDKPLMQHVAASDSSVQRKYKFEDEVEGDKKPVYASGNLSAVNMGSSCLQDNSCMTSTFIDDASLKSANIRQLQMIIDRLGARTKLCIRDSLYRLASSAEQSRYYDTADNISSESSPIIRLQGAKYSKRPAEILGVSISTNAIERSVACLLFHKSLELEHKKCS